MERGETDFTDLLKNMKRFGSDIMCSGIKYYWICMLHAVKALHQQGNNLHVDAMKLVIDQST